MQSRLSRPDEAKRMQDKAHHGYEGQRGGGAGAGLGAGSRPKPLHWDGSEWRDQNSSRHWMLEPACLGALCIVLLRIHNAFVSSQPLPTHPLRHGFPWPLPKLSMW